MFATMTTLLLPTSLEIFTLTINSAVWENETDLVTPVSVLMLSLFKLFEIVLQINEYEKNCQLAAFLQDFHMVQYLFKLYLVW